MATNKSKHTKRTTTLSQPIASVLRRHGIKATAKWKTRGVLAFTLRCGKRLTREELRFKTPNDPRNPIGDTPESLGSSLVERLAHIAWVVEGHLEKGRPQWLTEREWANHCDLSELLRRALPETAYLGLVHAD